jgi:Holliday junction DNA helicase RuvA
VIASVQGIVQHLGEDDIVLEVGGVGLMVYVPHSLLDGSLTVGKTLFLYTHLAVRESSLTLYGFQTREQRAYFELLLQISGIGPRLALAILSHLSPEVIRNAVGAGQTEVFAGVPGVGRKTAEKVIFHLKDRIAMPEEISGIPSEADTEVLTVLTALGYSLVEAQAALQTIPADAPEEVEARVKLALRHFVSP